MTGRVFQSALPRGERPITGGNKNGTYYFNPRSREGSDMMQLEKVERCRISIRAPARGATKNYTTIKSKQPISIRAPARGATMTVQYYLIDDIISIRAPARGATYECCQNSAEIGISIRAPARGATYNN